MGVGIGIQILVQIQCTIVEMEVEQGQHLYKLCCFFASKLTPLFHMYNITLAMWVELTTSHGMLLTICNRPGSSPNMPSLLRVLGWGLE